MDREYLHIHMYKGFEGSTNECWPHTGKKGRTTRGKQLANQRATGALGERQLVNSAQDITMQARHPPRPTPAAQHNTPLAKSESPRQLARRTRPVRLHAGGTRAGR
jgi:hypothetical protein